MSAQQVERITIRPSVLSRTILNMMAARVAMFVWGPPGLGKSQISADTATALGIAFIDVRLANMEPTDLRGMPLQIFEHGKHGVVWSAPLCLPSDIDLNVLSVAEYAESITVTFAAVNPMGSNGINIVTKPDFQVTSLVAGAEARIISSSPIHVEIALFKDGDIVPGAVRVRITGKARAIVGLEEFNSAAPTVVAASYQLVLDGRLGDYIVPEGVYLMAMGNRDTDLSMTYKMGAAIRNRFVHYELRADYDDWEHWSIDNNMHPAVLGYLSQAKHKLCPPLTRTSGSYAFESPRSWAFLSKILYAAPIVTNEEGLARCVGAVGDGSGVEFHEFAKFVAANLPKVADILSGAVKELPTKDAGGQPFKVEVQHQFFLGTALIYELRERSDKIKREHGKTWKDSAEYTQWLIEADNFLLFIQRNFQPEITVFSARSGIQQKLPFNTFRQKHFETFATRFRGVLST